MDFATFLAHFLSLAAEEARLALDVLPPAFGVLEIAGGFLLIVGLFTSFTALLLYAELLTAYFYAAVPRSVWPIRNGGNHVLLYF